MGEFEIDGTQAHFHLETHTCRVRPIEDGQLEVAASTQYVAKVQVVIAKALGISENAIDMKVNFEKINFVPQSQ